MSESEVCVGGGVRGVQSGGVGRKHQVICGYLRKVGREKWWEKIVFGGEGSG